MVLARGRQAIPYAKLGVLGEYLQDLASSRAPSTVRKRWHVLAAIERRIGEPIMTAPEARVRSWWRGTAGVLADGTRSVYLSDAREYSKWLIAEGHRDDDPTRRVITPRRPRRMPRPLPVNLVVQAMEGMRPRERLAVEVMLTTGMRREEVVKIRPDMDLQDDTEGVPWLIVHGKGGDERRLPLAPDLAVRIRAAAPAGWLFPSTRSSTGHITPDTLGHAVAGALRSAGIDATGHQLRHTAATAALKATGSLTAVQMMLGHRHVSSTEIYAQAEGMTPATATALHALLTAPAVARNS